MEQILTILTDKTQAFAGAILLAGLPTTQASLRGVVGIDFDGHTLLLQGFVGNHGVQFGKRPFGVHGIRFPLFDAGMFAFLAFGALSNVGQMLQSDQTVVVGGHNAFGHDMIVVCFQPSLSSADRHAHILWMCGQELRSWFHNKGSV